MVRFWPQSLFKKLEILFRPSLAYSCKYKSKVNLNLNLKVNLKVNLNLNLNLKVNLNFCLKVQQNRELMEIDVGKRFLIFVAVLSKYGNNIN